MTKGSLKGQVFTFNKTNIFIGRGPENDIIVSNDAKMSRKHVEIKNTGFEVTVINVSQKNFILVDGEKCEFKLITKPTNITLGDTEISLNVEGQQVNKSAQPTLQPIAATQTTAQVVSKNLITPSHLKAQQNVLQINQNKLSDIKTPQYIQSANNSEQKSFQNKSQFNNSIQTSSKKGFHMMLAVLILVGLAGYLFTNDQKQKQVDALKIRSSKDIEKDLDLSSSNMESLVKSKTESGQNSLEYRTAQEKYIAGFRDYRNGQYYRAMIFFQGALASYPDHSLAKKYYHLAKRKFDDQVQMHMIQGRKYRAKGNYNLCKSSFKSVLVMIKDPNEAVFKEANQLYNECNTLSEGRF